PAEKGDMDAASLRVAAIGHHQAEDARVEIDHRVEIERINADVAKLGVGHARHCWTPRQRLVSADVNTPAARPRPEFSLDFLLLWDSAVHGQRTEQPHGSCESRISPCATFRSPLLLCAVRPAPRSPCWWSVLPRAAARFPSR